MGYEKYSDEIAQQLDPNSIEGSLLLSELESDIQEELNQLLSKRFAEIQGDMKLANEGTGIGMTLSGRLQPLFLISFAYAQPEIHDNHCDLRPTGAAGAGPGGRGYGRFCASAADRGI